MNRQSTFALTLLLGVVSGMPQTAQAQGLNIAQSPLFVKSREAPLNMLVVGRDHKLFYEAYNDASDLNADGILDVGYRGHLTLAQGGVDYFGYFDSYKCYSYASEVFTPVSVTTNKRCGGSWSGDFLNYVTTVRVDAIRKVLYGGSRFVDTASQTILTRAEITQDGHSWGKEYESVARDGYDISQFTPLSVPAEGRRHLLVSTTLFADAATPKRPFLRVLNDSKYRIWEWVSIEGPVAGRRCEHGVSGPLCAEAGMPAGSFDTVPAASLLNLTVSSWKRPVGVGSPGNLAAMDALFSTYAFGATPLIWTPILCGTGPATIIRSAGTGSNNNPFTNCTTPHNNYLLQYDGKFRVTAPGTFEFAIDGDDAIDLYIKPSGASAYVRIADWYGGHGRCNCNTYNGTITLPVGLHDIRFRMEENTGGDNWDVRIKGPSIPASNITDYTVRVEVCKAGLLEDNCKAYSGGAKPTGLLHDYGETDRMFFGLLTGSYLNNTAGGVLRKAVSTFRDEVDPLTGRYTTLNGIVSTLDKLKITEFEAQGTGTDSNFRYNSCGLLGTGPFIENSSFSCKSWGNPLAEMLFESMRYWSGAAVGSTKYAAGLNPTAGNPAVAQTEAPLGLPLAQWSDPYAPGGFRYCAKPFNTIVSDINPSYDTDQIPGSAFSDTGVAGGGTYSGTIPTPLSAFNAATDSNAVSSLEGISGSYYIGESGTLRDLIPSPKPIAGFGSIRGLVPEEPTKRGGYYSAGVAFYGRTKDMSGATDIQNVQTFSVALASPLPTIDFPVGGGRRVSLVPFGKSVGGTAMPPPSSIFHPTNTIVDFYVEVIANTNSGNMDSTLNNGRPFAIFRINYEDVEQGNDHDMDFIVRYELTVEADGRLKTVLSSEYAAGSVEQHAGFVITGTTADGAYLEVQDNDGNQNIVYRLNTPKDRPPGYCDVSAPPADCAPLPGAGGIDKATRYFTVGSSPSSRFLKDPLWYAAKYGGFLEDSATANGRPDLTSEWDANGDGVPDNYFLVTNALGLRAQLARAFEEVLRRAAPSGALSTNSARIDFGSIAFQSFYDTGNWSGNVEAFNIDSRGVVSGTRIWSAKDLLAPRSSASRDIRTSTGRTTFVPFQYASLLPAQRATLGTDAAEQQAVVEWVRGEATNEFPNGRQFRDRTSKVGDILGSSPAVMGRQDFAYNRLRIGGAASSEAGSYRAFFQTKASPGRNTLFVGANAGMLHAFQADTGRERFAYVPRNVVPNLKLLTDRSYPSFHRYFVDGSPAIADAFVNGAWTSVLLGTTGAGGRSIFALNMANPDNPAPLWELTSNEEPELGFTIGQGEIVKRQSDGKWVAIFGNGYNSASHRAQLLVVDLETGAVLNQIDTGVGTLADPNGLGSPTSADTDKILAGTPNEQSQPNLMADFVYAGDLHGNMWRFDLTAGTATRIFTATDAVGGRQPIVAAPTLGPYVGDSDNAGVFVYFGTGRLFVAGDNDNNAPGLAKQTFYALLDSNTGVVSRGQMAPLTVDGSNAVRNVLGVPPSYPAQRGFYIDLANGLPGERILASPVLRFGQLFFATYAPQGDPCNPSALGYIMGVSPQSGQNTLIAPDAGCTNCGGLRVGSDTPIQPSLVVTDRYLVILTQYGGGTGTGGTGGGGTGGTGGSNNILIPRPAGRLTWKQIR